MECEVADLGRWEDLSLRAFIPTFAKALECILQLVMSAGATTH